MSMTREAIQQVEEFLRTGEKLKAIKHLKDTYGFSLEEAKILVESIEGSAAAAGAAFYHDKDEAHAAVRAQVTALLQRGSKLEAIRYAKSALRVRLKGARTFVEQIEREIGPLAVKSPAGVSSGLKIFLGIFAGLGMVFLSVAGWFFVSQEQTIANSETVAGRVVKLKPDANGNGSAPVIEYEWNNGTWLHASNIYTSPPAYSLDEQVKLFINRDNPSEVVIDTFTDRWGGVLIFGFLGFIFVLIPGIAYLLIRR